MPKYSSFNGRNSAIEDRDERIYPVTPLGRVFAGSLLIGKLIAAAGSRYTVKVGKEVDSQVIVASAWHRRSHAWSSVATAPGDGSALFVGLNTAVLDPLAAGIVSLWVVKVAHDTAATIECSREKLGASSSVPLRVELLNRCICE